MALDKVALPTTILLVEEETEFSNFFLGLLKDNGYDLLCAYSAEDAIQHSHDFKGKIDLMITNIKVGEESGIKLATRLMSQRPEMKVMLLSGYGFGTLVFDHGWHFLPRAFMSNMLTNRPSTSLAIQCVLERIRGTKLLAVVANSEFLRGDEYRGYRLLAVAERETTEIVGEIAGLTEDEADSVEPFFTSLEIYLSFLRPPVFLDARAFIKRSAIILN